MKSNSAGQGSRARQCNARCRGKSYKKSVKLSAVNKKSNYCHDGKGKGARARARVVRLVRRVEHMKKS